MNPTLVEMNQKYIEGLPIQNSVQTALNNLSNDITTANPVVQRDWWVGSANKVDAVINSTAGIEITSLISGIQPAGVTLVSTTNVNQGIYNPLVYDNINNVIKVDPSLSVNYNFKILLRINARRQISGTGTFRLELRRANGIDLLSVADLEYAANTSIPNTTPIFKAVEILTRVDSGGADPFQTQGFKLFIRSVVATTDILTLVSTDAGNNLQIYLVK